MTLEEIKASDEPFLNTTDIADIVGSDACDIRTQAHNDPTKLGYPVTVCGRRIKVPRRAFLHWLEYGYAAPARPTASEIIQS